MKMTKARPTAGIIHSVYCLSLVNILPIIDGEWVQNFGQCNAMDFEQGKTFIVQYQRQVQRSKCQSTHAQLFKFIADAVVKLC